jgi:hypothetical protein
MGTRPANDPNPSFAEVEPDPQSYATLLNMRQIIPSTSTAFFAVEQHLFFHLMESFLKKIQFDEAWYLRMHQDVRNAIEDGKVSSGWHHFARFGYYEHRMPYRITVDEDWYLDSYPDVREAIARRDYLSGQSHFEQSGYREGRLPYAGFVLSLVDEDHRVEKHRLKEPMKMGV